MKIKEKIFLIYKKITHILSGHGMERFRFVRVSNNLLISFLKPKFIEVHENKIFLDSNNCLRLSIRGVYKPFETDIVKKEIKKGDVVVRYWSKYWLLHINFCKACRQRGQCFCF